MSDSTASAAEKKDPVVEDKKSAKRPSSEPSFNMDELQALAALVNEHGFTDFEFENENIRVRLSKSMPSTGQVLAPPVAQPSAIQSAPPAAAFSPASEESPDPDEGLHKILSPIVGTFYRSPNPEKPSYVSEGSKVTPESVVCIVEAMKLMNEIQAEVTGEIVKIYVENETPVEYGQPLFGVKK